jgi:hypothetical protein
VRCDWVLGSEVATAYRGEQSCDGLRLSIPL